MNDEILLSETSDPEKINLFTSIEDKNPFVEEQHKYFLDYNHNKHIAFFKTDKQLSDFMLDFMNYHNKRVSESSPESYKKFKQKKINIKRPEINNKNDKQINH